MSRFHFSYRALDGALPLVFDFKLDYYHRSRTLAIYFTGNTGKKYTVAGGAFVFVFLSFSISVSRSNFSAVLLPNIYFSTVIEREINRDGHGKFNFYRETQKLRCRTTL